MATSRRLTVLTLLTTKIRDHGRDVELIDASAGVSWVAPAALYRQ